MFNFFHPEVALHNLVALAHGVPTSYADRLVPQTAAELSTMTRNAEFCPKILIFGLFEFLDFKDLILHPA